MKLISKIEVWGYKGCKGDIPCTRHLLVEKGGAFPGIVSFKDGEVCVFYRGTPDHVGKSNVSMIKSKDAGETWSSPQIVTADEDDRNPAVGVLEPDTLVMLYTSRSISLQKEKQQEEGARWQVKYRISEDRGKHWTSAKNIDNPPGYTLCSPGGGSNLLGWRDMLIGNVFGLEGKDQYHNQPVKEWFGFPLTYEPKNDKWTRVLPVIQSGSDETDFFDSPHGIGAMIRTGGFKLNACYTRYLVDNAWSKPVMAFPDGLHPARITALPNKMLLASIGRRRWPYGAQAMISKDGGKTWDWDNQFILADNCGQGEKRGDNGYCSSTILPDGKILSVWYKNLSDSPYFSGTGEIYTLEMAKYDWEDVRKFVL